MVSAPRTVCAHSLRTAPAPPKATPFTPPSRRGRQPLCAGDGLGDRRGDAGGALTRMAIDQRGDSQAPLRSTRDFEHVLQFTGKNSSFSFSASPMTLQK